MAHARFSSTKNPARRADAALLSRPGRDGERAGRVGKPGRRTGQQGRGSPEPEAVFNQRPEGKRHRIHSGNKGDLPGAGQVPRGKAASSAFGGCDNLTAISINEPNTNYTSVAGVLFKQGETVLVEFPPGKSGIYFIPGGVTNIGAGAFYACSKLAGITIPSSAISIGNSAFGSCINLTNVMIGNGVISIGNYAFSSCSNLLDIVIPDSVVGLGNEAFLSCVNLRSATIGNSVTNIGEETFAVCTSLRRIIVPDNVMSIGDGAFALCTSLSNVIVGNGVTSIGDYAFENCYYSLVNVEIGNSVRSIGFSAFANCMNLVQVHFSGNAPIPGSSVFSNDDKAIVYYLPGTTGWSSTFAGRPTMPEYQGVPYTYSTNNGAITITGYIGSGGAETIPDTINGLPVVIIGDGAFYNCANLTSITLPGTITDIGEDSFDFCTGMTNVTLPDGLVSLGNEAFYGCFNLPAVTIPDSVTNLGTGAFETCFNLTDVTIGAGVTSIGSDTFLGCTSLANIVIPTNVTSVGDSAFYGCIGLTNIVIPQSVTNIGIYAFSSCDSLDAITVDALNPFYCSVNGVLFDKAQALLIQYPGGKAGVYTIPDGVTSVGIEAFGDCTGLTGITIANSVTNIGDVAFIDCTNLAGITIGDGVTGIGSAAFAFCSGLTNVMISQSVTSLGDQVFYGCIGLTNIVIPQSVTSIGILPFASCDNLNTITVDVLNPFYCSIDGVLFDKAQTLLIQCPGGKSGRYAIPDSVTRISDGAFLDCIRLTGVTLGNSVTSIGGFAFDGCDNLTNIIIPRSVTGIDSLAFANCTNLNGVFFEGNAPVVSQYYVFFGTTNAIVYYLPGTTGWDATFGDRPTMLWNPLIQSSGPDFGIRTNRFGFNITGTTNIPIVVEACTNLASQVWQPLQSCNLTNGSIYFGDSQWTNYPGRFYRIRWP